MVTGMCSWPDDDTKVPPLAEEMLACGEANALCSALRKPPGMSVCVCVCFPREGPLKTRTMFPLLSPATRPTAELAHWNPSASAVRHKLNKVSGHRRAGRSKKKKEKERQNTDHSQFGCMLPPPLPRKALGSSFQ